MLLALVAILGAACFGDDAVPRDSGDGPGEDSPPVARPGDADDDDSAPPPADGSINDEPDDGGPAVVSDEPPAGTASSGTGSSGAGTVDLGIGSYCWGRLCVDKIGHMTGKDALTLGSGETFLIGGPLTSISFEELMVQVWPLPNEPIADGPDWIAWPGGPTIDGGLEVAVSSPFGYTVNLPPGRYLVSLFVRATGGGDASYGLMLEVVEPGEPPPDDSDARVEVLAPIEDAQLTIAESFPPQYFVQVTSGQPNGCARFARYEVARDGTAIEITVYNTIPADPNVICTLVYSTTESNVALGSDFVPGQTYDVRVNDLKLTFTAQ